MNVIYLIFSCTVKNSFRHRWNWTYIRYNHCSCEAITVIHRSKDSFRTMKTIKIWLSKTATKYKLYIWGANNWTSVGASLKYKDSFLSHINERSSNFWKIHSDKIHLDFFMSHRLSQSDLTGSERSVGSLIIWASWIILVQKTGIL